MKNSPPTRWLAGARGPCNLSRLPRWQFCHQKLESQDSGALPHDPGRVMSLLGTAVPSAVPQLNNNKDLLTQGGSVQPREATLMSLMMGQNERKFDKNNPTQHCGL